MQSHSESLSFLSHYYTLAIDYKDHGMQLMLGLAIVPAIDDLNSSLVYFNDS